MQVVESYANAVGKERDATLPWDDLKYIVGEIMYGGHITDIWDRRVCAAYLENMLTAAILKVRMRPC